MKKLVLMLAVVFSMSFFACGNKEAAAETEAAPVEETENVEAAAEVVDTLTNDTTVTVVVEEAAEVAPVEEAK